MSLRLLIIPSDTPWKLASITMRPWICLNMLLCFIQDYTVYNMISPSDAWWWKWLTLTSMPVAWELDKHRNPAFKNSNIASLVFAYTDRAYAFFVLLGTCKISLPCWPGLCNRLTLNKDAKNTWHTYTVYNMKSAILLQTHRKKLLRRPKQVKTIRIHQIFTDSGHDDIIHIPWHKEGCMQTSFQNSRWSDLNLITWMGGSMVAGWTANACGSTLMERMKKKQFQNTFLFRGQGPTLTWTW